MTVSPAGNTTSLGRLAAALGLALAVSACASDPGPQGPGAQAAKPRVVVDPLALFYVGMDMDDDLVISQEELEDRAPIQFARADTDGDNHLRPLELTAWVEQAIGTRDAPYGMGSFDRVGDGQVTEAEFVGFLTLRFNALDKNNNGQLERSEISRVVDPAAMSRPGGQGGPGSAGPQRRRR